jgi:hypothetical protein
MMPINGKKISILMQIGKKRTRDTPRPAGWYCTRDNEPLGDIKGGKLLDQARNHKDTASVINHVVFTFLNSADVGWW